MLPFHALVRTENERSAFEPNRTHKRQPCFSRISRRSQIEIDILRIQTLSEHRHVVFPANCRGQRKFDAIDCRGHSTQSAWTTLSPDQSLRSSWHDFSPLSKHTQLRAHIHNSTIEASARLLDEAGDNEDTGISCNALQLLSCTIPPKFRALGYRQCPFNPCVACSSRCVTEINRTLEMFKELVPSSQFPIPNRNTEIACAWIST